MTVSHGSAATSVRCGGTCSKRFVANLLLNSSVKEFWKSINISRSYAQKNFGVFFMPHSVDRHHALIFHLRRRRTTQLFTHLLTDSLCHAHPSLRLHFAQWSKYHIFGRVGAQVGPITLKFELGGEFLTMHLPTNLHHLMFKRPAVIVLTNIQTNKQIHKQSRCWKHPPRFAMLRKMCFTCRNFYVDALRGLSRYVNVNLQWPICLKQRTADLYYSTQLNFIHRQTMNNKRRIKISDICPSVWTSRQTTLH